MLGRTFYCEGGDTLEQIDQRHGHTIPEVLKAMLGGSLRNLI